MTLITTLIPLFDVLTEVGFVSADPQLLTRYGTSFRTSAVVASGALAAVGIASALPVAFSPGRRSAA